MELMHAMQAKGKADGIVPYQFDRSWVFERTKVQIDLCRHLQCLLSNEERLLVAEDHGKRITYMAARMTYSLDPISPDVLSNVET